MILTINQEEITKILIAHFENEGYEIKEGKFSKGCYTSGGIPHVRFELEIESKKLHPKKSES